MEPEWHGRGLAAVIAITLGLSACMPLEPGESGVKAEFNRLQGRHGFAVISSAPTRTVFVARGREVVIAPASGFCVAEDSLDVSGTAAFVLLSDCTGRSAARSMRTFPGVLTVSVSGAPMVDPGSSTEQALAGLESFLSGEGGRALLGRGREASKVRVRASRRVGDGLYVLVEDGNAAPLPVLAPRFWRAFVDLGGRMAMITASGFRDVPVGEGQMLAFLVRQVVALKRANNSSTTAEEMRLAEQLDGDYTVASTGTGNRVDVQIETYGSGDDVAEADIEETHSAGQAVATLPGSTSGVVPYGGFTTDRAGSSGAAAAARPSQPATKDDPPAPVPRPAAGSARPSVASTAAVPAQDPPYGGPTGGANGAGSERKGSPLAVKAASSSSGPAAADDASGVPVYRGPSAGGSDPVYRGPGAG